VNLARRTRFACLGSFKTIDRFDWAHPEKIDRALIERLVDLDFEDGGENVLLKGGSGLGKTMIAQNLAQAALAAGFTVRFSTLAAALADLLGQESMPAFERRLRRYTNPDLLILDELTSSAAATSNARRSSPPTSPSSSGATPSPVPPALSHSSIASLSTATASRSSASPGETSIASIQIVPHRSRVGHAASVRDRSMAFADLTDRTLVRSMACG
jgi:hypothetical protein